MQHGRALIAVAEARARVLQASAPLGHESVTLDAALDRVLARGVRATGDVPPFACAAMDGYAISAGPGKRGLRVIGESRAGAPSQERIGEDDAIAISTGAALPAGASAVIRQEDVVRRGSVIDARAAVGTGADIRGAGEDMRAGETVLAAGTKLGACELAAAAAAGAAELTVVRRPRVCILCTGDELRAPGLPLRAGEIHNSGGPMLAALARRCGAIVAPVQSLPDRRDAIVAGLASALQRSDLVIVSGGVSVGPHDHVKAALAKRGVSEVFWGVALQPGKPVWFGSAGATLVLALPGNPVSAAVTFSLFARVALTALQGDPTPQVLDRRARLGVTVLRHPRCERALCVRLQPDDSCTRAFPSGRQGSHLLTSLLGADAFALIPPGEGELAAGSMVALVAPAR